MNCRKNSGGGFSSDPKDFVADFFYSWNLYFYGKEPSSTIMVNHGQWDFQGLIGWGEGGCLKELWFREMNLALWVARYLFIGNQITAHHCFSATTTISQLGIPATPTTQVRTQGKTSPTSTTLVWTWVRAALLLQTQDIFIVRASDRSPTMEEAAMKRWQATQATRRGWRFSSLTPILHNTQS